MELLTRGSSFLVMMTNEFCFAELVRAMISYDSYKNQINYLLLSNFAHPLYLLQHSVMRVVCFLWQDLLFDMCLL